MPRFCLISLFFNSVFERIPMTIRKTWLAASVSAALFSLAAQAADETTPAAAAESGAQTQTLQNITVPGVNRSTRTENKDTYTTSAMKTTTGLALSPKETPQSVSVITKKQLSERGITNMQDALKTTTGINVIPDSARWRYQSRGFFIDKIEEDGIATSVPGSSGNPWNDPQSMTNLAIYDHIEVVRGATGLTQSNGEPGGTINAVRKKPTAKTQASATVQADRFGKVYATGDVSGSLNEAKTVRGRLVGAISRNDNFQDKKAGNEQMIYGVADANLGENTKITAGAMFQHNQETPEIYGVPMGNGFNLNLPYKTYLGADWNKSKFNKLNVFTELEHYFNDDWKVSSKLDFTRSTSEQNFAFIANTGGRFPGVVRNGLLSGATENIQNYQNTGRTWAWQNNLTGKFDLFGKSHDVFATHSYIREKSDSYNVWKARKSHPYNVYTFDWGSLNKPDWSKGNANYTDTSTTVTNHALSVGVRWNPLDNLHILSAWRFTHWTHKSENHKTKKRADYHKNTFVPYLGINYDITPNHTLYGSYTTIDKPQRVVDMNNSLLDPIKGKNYELGWKADWFGNGKLQSSLALFRVYQTNRPYDLDKRNSAGEWAYVAQGKIRSQGFEAELSGNITDNWMVFAGYTYNTSKYMQNEGGSYTIGTNFSKHTPRHMFRLFTSYRLPFDNQKWTINGGITAQSSTNSLWNVGQGGYMLVDAGVSYKANDNFTVSLVGRNLGDKRYYENHRVRTMGINNLYGEPRNIMLKVDWKL